MLPMFCPVLFFTNGTITIMYGVGRAARTVTPFTPYEKSAGQGDIIFLMIESLYFYMIIVILYFFIQSIFILSFQLNGLLAHDLLLVPSSVAWNCRIGYWFGSVSLLERIQIDLRDIHGLLAVSVDEMLTNVLGGVYVRVCMLGLDDWGYGGLPVWMSTLHVGLRSRYGFSVIVHGGRVSGLWTYIVAWDWCIRSGMDWFEM